jgi:outer membrane protein assembly factor BamA
VAGNIAFYRGDPATTRISSSVASITVTTKKQAGISARTTMVGGDDRWRLETDYRFQWTSQDTFGLGIETARAVGEVARFDFYRLYQSAYVQVTPALYVGGGLHLDNHTNVGPEDEAEASWPDSAYVQYSLAHGLPTDSQISAGPSVEVIWDTRDSFINSDRGWLARLNYRVLFDAFLGGDSHWDKVNLDVRTYRRLSKTGRHKLAVWAYADHAKGHFRGERLAFLELEYRAPLMRNGLLGWVAFLNATTMSNRDGGERLFDHAAPGGGAGLRLLLNKRSKTNLAFDVGFGERGNRGICLAVQEAL